MLRFHVCLFGIAIILHGNWGWNLEVRLVGCAMGFPPKRPSVPLLANIYRVKWHPSPELADTLLLACMHNG